MPLSPYFTEILKAKLQAEYVQYLPPLIKPSSSEEKNIEKNISRAFSAFIIGKICDESPQVAKCVVDDFDDAGLDAIYLKDDTVFLLQSKFKTKETFDQGEALKFLRGVRKILKCDFGGMNKHVTDRAAEITQAIENFDHIQLIVAHSGSGISAPAKTAFDEFFDEMAADEPRLITNILDLDYTKIVEFLISEETFKKVNTSVSLESFNKIDQPFETVFGIVPLEQLVNIHNEHGLALYERNIRTYLGTKNKLGVNESIQKTLLQSPTEFFYLNNGVTALYETIKEKGRVAGKGNKKFLVTGLSIINGAQTISSSAASGADSENLTNAKVMITLIKAEAEADMGRKVTKARNHQNPVNFSDFVSLEAIQEKLRRECALSDVIYNYKAGQSFEGKGGTKISLQQAVNALALRVRDPRIPVKQKKSPSLLTKTDSDEYKQLFPEDLSGIELINSFRLNSVIEKLIQSNIWASNGFHSMIYNHGRYALSWIFANRCNRILNCPTKLTADVIENMISKPFDDVRSIFDDIVHKRVLHSYPGPLGTFRNQSVALSDMKKIMIKAYNIAEDDAGLKANDVYVSGENYPIKLFNYLISKAPQIELPK